MKKSKELVEQQTEQDSKKTTRRRVIKTAIASTAVVGAASQLSAGKWTKPMLNSVILPAHAETTDSSGNSPAPPPDPCPEGPLVCAADPLQRVTYRNDGREVVTSSYDVTATVCPPEADVSVQLAVTAVDVNNAYNENAYLLGPNLSPQDTNASGVATFSEVVLAFGAEIGGAATARVDLVFSAGGDQCSLSLSFTESLRPSGPPDG